MRGPNHLAEGAKSGSGSLSELVNTSDYLFRNVSVQMIIKLEKIEKILIEQNLTTRDEIETLKKKRYFGRAKCRILGQAPSINKSIIL